MSLKKYKFTGKDDFKISDFKTSDKGEFKSREDAVEEFVENLKEINVLQQKLYAERKEGVIFVFQAMDAAGKDGCIRTVFSTLTPHGVKEYCFKAPSVEESSHDYLWRFWSALPARGNISIFNRSYYEDVLIGKVHKLYENQIVPDRMKNIDVIKKRYKEINDFEEYLYNNATRIVKIFLNVSKEEQAKRFISRIDTPKKNWKVSENDIKEREYWDEYQEAFETMVNNTSCEKSPWYVVPADHKWYARLIVSRIVLNTLKEIDPHFPNISEKELERVQTYKEKLMEDISYKTEKGEGEKNTEVENEVLLETCESVDESEAKTEIFEPFESNEECELKEKSKKKDKKKDKKKKKKEKKKKKKKIKELDKDLNESVFFDASEIVTDTFIEGELERLDEQIKEIENEEDEVCEGENEDTTTIEENTTEENNELVETV